MIYGDVYQWSQGDVPVSVTVGLERFPTFLRCCTRPSTPAGCCPRGALEGTKSGKDCSSSSAVDEASVPRQETSVEGCVAKWPNWQSLFGDGSSRSSETSRVGGATTKEGEEEGGGFWPFGRLGVDSELEN